MNTPWIIGITIAIIFFAWATRSDINVTIESLGGATSFDIKYIIFANQIA